MTVYNFGAGPSTLPKEVLEQASSSIKEGVGLHNLSILEISHRSAEFQHVLEQLNSDLYKLLDIPSEYSILWFSGGATLQFSAAVLNLLLLTKDSVDVECDYYISGTWSKKAADEAIKLGCKVNLLQMFENGKAVAKDKIKFNKNAFFTYYCENETIEGIRLDDVDKNGYLVCDMSSSILTKKFNVRKFDIIFAGAQKNMGAAGITFVIINDRILNRVKKSSIPTMLDYEVFKKHRSLYNTPPVYAIYIVMLMVKWIIAQGGLSEMELRNKNKSKTIYDVVDCELNEYILCPVPKEHRSTCNIIIRSKNAKDKEILEYLQNEGCVGLEGHRSVGGIRVSNYNSIDQKAIESFIYYLKKYFKNKH